MKLLASAAIVLAAQMAMGATTFDIGFNTTPGLGAGAADSSVGDPNEQVGPPLGPGGTVVTSPVHTGSGSLDRSTGGRVEYQTAGNVDFNKATVEVWLNKPNMSTDTGFRGLWGTDTSSGNQDIRMYTYGLGGGIALGGYMLGGGNPFWEIEQVIPTALLTDNEWHHAVWQWDLAAGTTSTFWDGQLLRSTPDAGVVAPRSYPTNTLFHIGENQAGSAIFNGYMDDFRISDTNVYPVPEPASLGLLMVGGTFLLRRRK